MNRQLLRPVFSGLTAAAFLGGAFALAAAPASAHPDEVSQTIEVSSHGNEIRVHWNAAPHDLDTLAVELGIVPESRTFVYEQGELVEDESDSTELQLLEQNPDVLGEYLLSSISAKVDAQECTGEFHGAEGISAGEGAWLTFTCAGEPGANVELTATTLQNLGTGYETQLVETGTHEHAHEHNHEHAHEHDHAHESDHVHDDDHSHSHDHEHPDSLATYTAEDTAFELSFDDHGNVQSASLVGAFNPTLLIVISAVVVILAAGGVVLWLRRRRTKTPSTNN